MRQGFAERWHFRIRCAAKCKVTAIVRPEDVVGGKVTRIVRESWSRRERSPRLSFLASVQALNSSIFAGPPPTRVGIRTIVVTLPRAYWGLAMEVGQIW